MIYRLLIIFLTLFAVASNLSAAQPYDMQDALTQGFQRAFSDPEEFKRTGLFQLLGYPPRHVQLIGKVTPRPASLKVFADPDNTAPTSFRNIRVECQKIRYYNLTIDRGVFEFPGVVLDPDALAAGHLIFRKATEIKLETFVSEKDILKVFELFAKARKLSRLRISLRERETGLSGRVKKGMFLIHFRIHGNPRIEANSRIIFQCRRLQLNGLPLPKALTAKMFRRINPVFDVARTWMNLYLETMNVKDGLVHTTARILPPKTAHPRTQ